jgi:hypothetical protein
MLTHADISGRSRRQSPTCLHAHKLFKALRSIGKPRRYAPTSCSHSASIRQHTSAYVGICQCQHVSIRQHASAHVSIRQHTSAYVSMRQHTSAYVSIRQHTSAYVSIRQHTSAYVSIRQYTSVYVSIRQHTSRRHGRTSWSESVRSCRSGGRGGREQLPPDLWRYHIVAVHPHHLHMSACVSIHQHTYVSIRTSVDVRQNASAYVSIRQRITSLRMFFWAGETSFL